MIENLIKLDVVIVTFNRLEKLQHTLICYETQSQSFRNLIVVNNNSTDGTKEFLDSWKEADTPYKKHVINMNKNLGGAGGFYEGQNYAMKMNPDWIFIADDDAYPDANMIERFYTFLSVSNDPDHYSAICSSVYNIDDTLCTYHRQYISKPVLFKYQKVNSTESDYSQNFNIDLLSYVGAFLNTNALRQIGLVYKDYFIYYDDSEHSLRLKKYGTILCVPEIKMFHDGGLEAARGEYVTWRDYYSIRNRMHMLKKHYPLVAFSETLFYFIKKPLGYVKRLFVKEKVKGLNKIKQEALMDAWRNKLGVHEIYKPGWTFYE